MVNYCEYNRNLCFILYHCATFITSGRLHFSCICNAFLLIVLQASVLSYEKRLVNFHDILSRTSRQSLVYGCYLNFLSPLNAHLNGSDAPVLTHFAVV